MFVPTILFAVMGLGMFWVTIIQPEKVALQESTDKEEVWLDSPAVLEAADAQEPAVLLAQGKTQQAVEAASKLAEAKPHDVVASVVAGNVLWQSGDKDGGMRYLKRSVALAPRSRFVRLNLADKLAAEKKYPEAIVQYDLVLAQQPEWVKARRGLADVYLQTSEWNKAAAELAKILQAEPNNGEVRKLYGLCLGFAGKGRDGLKEYILGESTQLSFSGLPADLKRQTDAWGSLERATIELRRQLSLQPDDPMTKLTLARVLSATGQLPEAKTLLLEARKKSPTNPDIHRNLAVVMQKLGEPNLALAEFNLSISLQKAQQTPIQL